jgi:poly(3-hydroxybutyrate) depolymerase
LASREISVRNRGEREKIKWRMDDWKREQSEAETWRKIQGCRGEREDKMGLMREETEYCVFHTCDGTDPVISKVL